MSWRDRLTSGADRVAKEAEKAFEQGKTKVEQVQLERQMDAAARKLGYLEYDAYLGRETGTGDRQSLLEEMASLEQQIARAAEAKAAEEEAEATGPATGGTQTPPPTTGTGTGSTEP